MEKKVILSLKPGTELIQSQDCTSVRWGECVRSTRRTGQAAALHALSEQPQSLLAVSALLTQHDDTRFQNGEIAIVTAEFILEFGDFIESNNTDCPGQEMFE